MGSKLPVPAFLCFLTLCFLPAAEMNSSDNDFVNVLRWTETLIGSQNRGDKPLKIRNILTISKQMVTGNFYDMKLEFSRASCPKDHANDCAFDASATPLICEVKVYDEPISGTRTSPKFSCSSMQREGNNSTLELKAGDPEPSSVEVTTTTTTESSAKFCESIPKGQLNAISKEGITKLYAAAQSGDVPLTEKLLNCGANPLRSFHPAHLYLVPLSLFLQEGIARGYRVAPARPNKPPPFGPGWPRCWPGAKGPLRRGCADVAGAGRWSACLRLHRLARVETLTAWALEDGCASEREVSLELEESHQSNILTSGYCHWSSSLLIALPFRFSPSFAMVAMVRSSNLQEGNLPIHIAALNGHERIVEALLNHGVNPDVRRKDGLAALHIALKGDGTNLLPVLEMLALKGANLNVVTGNEQHKRPLDIALDVGLPNDVIRFLIEHGAKRGDETL
ncbi:unnamed protein product [Notodromas monacha]|uniref:Uncharacterized protein n=1 Tax=Notodromas monacha TaxID=399045 RepID=A0A7R9BVR0_9CRUS|nr:unnamed protein product [Notodromas monacha]CAG0922677.1 unnamed protein product [Notodromas monacha]